MIQGTGFRVLNPAAQILVPHLQIVISQIQKWRCSEYLSYRGLEGLKETVLKSEPGSFHMLCWLRLSAEVYLELQMIEF